MGERLLKTFGRRVREHRLAVELSQEKLAELSGLHRNLIGLIERGETNPTLLSMVKIAKVLNTKLADLLHGIA